jgi:predicted transposase/invertase (TIGR01784 family)
LAEENGEMVPGIDPKVDYAFTFLFGNERDTRSLIHLLNAILNPTPEEQIVEVQILNPFTDKVDLDDKLSILDIKARDQLGRQFNIEMQTLATPSLRQRILYYWAKLYTEQLQRGEDYELLRPTISVCFVDAVMFPTVREDHVAFRLTDAGEGVTLTDDLTIHFFELPKFILTADELRTPLDVWLYFLRNAQTLDTERLPGLLDTDEIRQAMGVLTMLGDIDIQREIYEGRLKARRDKRMFEYDAEKATEKAAAEGLARGLAEGLVRGIEQGLEPGLTSGALIGQIEFFQRHRGGEVTSRAELAAMPLAALEALAVQLERELTG